LLARYLAHCGIAPPPLLDVKGDTLPCSLTSNLLLTAQTGAISVCCCRVVQCSFHGFQ
jgi:hypothetical protein